VFCIPTKLKQAISNKLFRAGELNRPPLVSSGHIAYLYDI